MIGVLQVERMFARSATGVDELARLIRGADSEIVGNVFKFTDQGAIDSVAGRADDVRATFLMDPEVLPKKKFRATRELFARTGVDMVPHGEMPQKLHAKGFVFDRERAWLSTSPVMPLGDMLDFTATFSGDAARSLRELTLSGISGNVVAMRRAADDAARFGILLNDRHAGITHLRDGVKQLVDDADRELIVLTKTFKDKKLAQRIVRRAEEGVDVLVVSRTDMMSKSVRRMLEQSKVRFIDDVDRMIHGNAIVADGSRAYFGSGHMTARAMGRSSADRSSRELGAIVAGDDAAFIRREILDFSAAASHGS